MGESKLTMNNTGLQYHGKILIQNKFRDKIISSKWINSGTEYLQQLFSYALLVGEQQVLLDNIAQLSPYYLNIVEVADNNPQQLLNSPGVAINKRLSIDANGNQGVQITATVFSSVSTTAQKLKLQLIAKNGSKLAESQEIPTDSLFQSGTTQTMITWFLYIQKGESNVNG